MPETPKSGSQPPAQQALPALGPFQNVLDYVRERLREQVSVPSPFQSPVDTTTFRSVLARGNKLLPDRYQSSYVDVLARSLHIAEIQLSELKTRWRKKARQAEILQRLSEIFSVLAAPIVQLDSRDHEAELKAYLALASNLHQRFLSDGKIAQLNYKRDAFPQVDPLGFFSAADSQPAIWSPSAELPVALVSKPANQMNCLPLWVIDGHEVGGHGIYSHLPGFDGEIADALGQAIGSQAQNPGQKLFDRVVKNQLVSLIAPYNRRQEVPVAKFYAHIARTYSQELAADVAGVLNLGPMFVNGLIVYLAARHKEHRLSHTGPVVNGQRLDAYPPDVLRALVAIETVKQLDLRYAQQWHDLLYDRLITAYGGALPEHFSFVGEQEIHKITIPCADILALVPILTTSLLKSKLPSLANRSLQQVLTWSEVDERVVAALASRLNRVACTIDDLEDVEARHVVAASLQALEQCFAKAARDQTADTARKTMAARIHKNGITLLKSFYLEQCILCAVPTYGKTRRGDEEAQLCDLQDLLKRVRSFSSRS